MVHDITGLLTAPLRFEEKEGKCDTEGCNNKPKVGVLCEDCYMKLLSETLQIEAKLNRGIE